MIVHTYRTIGGKDFIREFINSLTHEEKVEGLSILERLENGSIDVLDCLNIKKFEGKIWEIKFRKFNRIFYVLLKGDNIYLLHVRNRKTLLNYSISDWHSKERKKLNEVRNKHHAI